MRWRSDRVRVRRQPARGRYDRSTIDAVLDSSWVAHVAFVDDGQPYCLPMLYARAGDTVLVHGSTASRAMRVLGSGRPACLTVTRLDGLVLARSAFQHSANYGSVVLVGGFRPLVEPDEKLLAFRTLTERLVPGRWSEVRPPNARELRAAAILAMTIDEASAKVRNGPPSDDRSRDAALDVWAGVVPVATSLGDPQASPGLRDGVRPSASVLRLLDRRKPRQGTRRQKEEQCEDTDELPWHRGGLGGQMIGLDGATTEGVEMGQETHSLEEEYE